LDDAGQNAEKTARAAWRKFLDKASLSDNQDQSHTKRTTYFPRVPYRIFPVSKPISVMQRIPAEHGDEGEQYASQDEKNLEY
jgi:hypothetical protein